MRDIKYRGKCLDNDKWVFGVPCKFDGATYVGKANRWAISTGVIKSHEVDPETLGQYTGLKDKNDVEIYEGDIFAGGIEGGPRIVEWGEPEAGFYVYDNGNTYYFASTIDPSKEEVVGNIHDNPELLIL